MRGCITARSNRLAQPLANAASRVWVGSDLRPPTGQDMPSRNGAPRFVSSSDTLDPSRIGGRLLV